MVRRAGNQRVLRGRRRRQRLAGDADGQRVACRLVAPRGTAHQIDTDAVVAVRRHNPGEPLAGHAAGEHRDIAAVRREDVEIVGAVAGLHRHAQRLPGPCAHLVVDIMAALDLALDERRFRARGKLDALAAAIGIVWRCYNLLCSNQRDDNPKQYSIHVGPLTPSIVPITATNSD